MRRNTFCLIAGLVLVHAFTAVAATRYVNVNNSTPASPYTNWVTAATNIQVAVDAAAAGDTVLVTNGVYETGARRVYGSVPYGAPYRVAVTKAITIQSVNGAQATVIRGQRQARLWPGGHPVSDGTRCAYLTNGASLVGFTLTNGAAVAEFPAPGPRPRDWECGGGVWCEPTNATAADCTVADCILAGNMAASSGGGAFGGTLFNCVLSGNSAGTGGGASGSTLYNSTLTGNSAGYDGGGVCGGTLYNCIVYYNTAPAGPNYCTNSGALAYCCTTPLPEAGAGNFTNVPGLVSLQDAHLLAGSACIDAGTNLPANWPTDMDGEPRTNGPRVDVGCDEFWDAGVTGPLSVSIWADATNVVVGRPVEFRAQIAGRVLGYAWSLGDGQEATNLWEVTHAYGASGNYPVVLAASNHTMRVEATVTVSVVDAETIYYVATNGAHVYPYTNWSTAATNIQAAIDAAVVGTRGVVVSNGVYDTGQTNVYYGTPYRIAVTKPITVRSTNGPAATVIKGQRIQYPWGDEGIRCAYLTNGASLVGFTLANGAAVTSGPLPPQPNPRDWECGGGVWCEPTNVTAADCTVADCILAGNMAASSGGGACGGTLFNCVLSGNSAGTGGGASGSTLYNSTLTGNSAGYDGGGVCGGTLYNCIVYYNTAPAGPNYCTNSGALAYCCTTPLPEAGAGNFTNVPGLVSLQDAHLLAGSACIDAGTNLPANWPTDMDGEPRTNGPRVDVGCDEFWDAGVTGPLSVSIWADATNVVVGGPVEFRAQITGRVLGYVWWLGDGQEADNIWEVTHAYAARGAYSVFLMAWNLTNGALAVLPVSVVGADTTYYVATNGAHVYPYTEWSTAATNIQAAIDAAAVGTRGVVVSNGVYDTGQATVYGVAPCRIAVTKPITVRSVNGSAATVIKGQRIHYPWGDDEGTRCACLTNGASLVGFTLANGAAVTSGPIRHPPYPRDWECGGGVWCASTNETVANCILVGNMAADYGGGAWGGTLFNCALNGNSAGAGGGASGSTLYNSTLTGNSAYSGGGAYGSTLHNCMLTNNMADDSGGGAYSGILNNCTVVDNWADDSGGGAAYATLNNCIVGYNVAWDGENYFEGTLNYCCTTPLPTNGLGNIRNAPLFMNYDGGNLRLQANSPCINAGLNSCAPGPIDLDGNPRIVNGTVDIGAYEFQGPGSVISYAWLQQYGLPTDGAADYADADHDGLNNWQEWIAGTDPTNAASALRMLWVAGTVSDVTVAWSSVVDRSYSLERATSLGTSPSFSLLCSNIAGLTGTTTFIDTNAVSAAACFYRVRVEQ